MATPAQLGSDTGPGDKLGGVPEQNPETTQGGAPAGETFSDGELPSVAVPGGQPFTTGGYSPQADQDSLPRPGSSDGCGLPPSGIRK
jgi:hypothetical protein